MRRSHWKASDPLRENVLLVIPTLFGCTCSYPTSYYLLQVNQYWTTRTSLQFTFKHLYINIKYTTWRDNPWHHKDASWGEGREQPKRHIKRATVQTWNLAHCLPPAQNTIITHRVILTYQHAYQTHLEKIADFLLCGERTWRRHVLSGIEFFDVSTTVEAQPGADTFPPLHHFCNHTLKSETIYLLDNWKKCVASAGVKMPHHTISVWWKW